MNKVRKWASSKLLLMLALMIGLLSPKQVAAASMGLLLDRGIVASDANGNVSKLEGAARTLFYRPADGDTPADAWAIGSSDATTYHLVDGKWVAADLPEDMTGYTAVSVSNEALTDTQVDALVAAGGNLSGVVETLEKTEAKVKTLETEVATEQAKVTDLENEVKEEQVKLADATNPLTEEEQAAIAQERTVAIARGNMFVGGVSGDEIFRRSNITANTLSGNEWKAVADETGLYELPGGLVSAAIDGRGSVWARNSSNQVMFKISLSSDDDWEPVEGSYAQIVTNNRGLVLAVDPNGNVFQRTGITDVDANGTEWVAVEGAANFLAINDNNMIYRISTDGTLAARANVTDQNAIGDSWAAVAGPESNAALRAISLSKDNIVWAITKDTGSIYVRDMANEAAVWTEIAGQLKQVVATAGGAWGLDSANKVFFRQGATVEALVASGWTGPLPGSVDSLFVSGVELEVPKLDNKQKNLKKKKKSNRVAKLKKKAKKLSKKLKKAKGAKKKKLAKQLKNLKKKIKKLSKKSSKKKGKKSRKGKKAKKGKKSKKGKKKRKKGKKAKKDKKSKKGKKKKGKKAKKGKKKRKKGKKKNKKKRKKKKGKNKKKRKKKKGKNKNK